MVLSPVPVMKPRKEPIAALRASPADFLPQYISERNAPRKEPRIIPIGVKMIPRIRPTNAPRSAKRLPPVIFVKYIGTTQSTTDTMATTTPQMTRVFICISSGPQMQRRRRPTQLIGVPGSPGRILPAIPITPASIARIMIIVSIMLLLCIIQGLENHGRPWPCERS